MKRLEAGKLIEFMQMLHQLQSVTRVMHVPGEDRFENDLEHSYILAMAAWYAIDTFSLPLDRDKAIRYALAHDVPEVHAGDTYVYSKDAAALESKKEREEEARRKLAGEFPSVPDMHQAMEDYENGADAEAIFVRALDKTMPLMTNFVQDGRTIKAEGVTFSQIAELKRRTTEKCPEVRDLTEQLLDLFDKDQQRFFGDRAER